MRKAGARLFWAGAFAVCFIVAATGWITGAFGRDYILLKPHSAEMVEANRIFWSEGEPVAPIYGNPSSRPIRVMWPDPAKVFHPEEDPSQTFYRADEYVVQAQTLWFFAEKALWMALLALLTGGLLYLIPAIRLSRA